MISYHKHHQAIIRFEYRNQVFPYRPDQSWGVKDAALWMDCSLETSEITILDLSDYLEALAKRVNHFHSIKVSSIRSHCPMFFWIYFWKYQKNRQHIWWRKYNWGRCRKFGSFIILYLCKLSTKNWTMQIHLGALAITPRDLWHALVQMRAEIRLGFSSSRKNVGFLNKLEKEDALPKTIFYNVNPADNLSIATMLGNFQGESRKMQFGSGWWHLDQRDGMVEQIKLLQI